MHASKLAAVWDRARHPRGVVQPFQVWRLFFRCEIIGGEPQCGPKTSEVAFFAEHELPCDLSTRRVLLPQPGTHVPIQPQTGTTDRFRLSAASYRGVSSLPMFCQLGGVPH
jgi:hypothetical protein